MKTRKYSKQIRVFLALTMILTFSSFSEISAVNTNGSLVVKVMNRFDTTKTYHWKLRAHYLDVNSKEHLIEDGSQLTLYGELRDGTLVEITQVQALLNSETNHNIDFKFTVEADMFVSFALYWNEPNINVYISLATMTPERYDVSYHANEGVFKEGRTSIVLPYFNQEKLSQNSDYQEPTRRGYTFMGWQINDKVWNMDIDRVGESIELQAIWTKDVQYYNVVFDSMGGSDVDSYTGIQENTLIQEPVAPYRLNYSFSGWYRDRDLFIPWDFSSDVITSNLSLYAKWDLNHYRVSFDSAGGSPQDEISVEHNTTVNRPSDPIKPGHQFIGWYLNESPWDFDTMAVTSDLILTARWDFNKYSVSFESNGGSLVESMSNISFLETIKEPETPSRFGYIFSGWYQDETFNNLYRFDSLIENDLTLHARWTPETYSVRFGLQGGVGVRDLESVNHGSLLTHLDIPVKEGYRFAGWYSSMSPMIPFVGTPIYHDTVLIASWELIQTDSTPVLKPRPDKEISMRPTHPSKPYVIPNSGNTEPSDLFITEEKKEELVLGKHPDIKKDPVKEVKPSDSEALLEVLKKPRVSLTFVIATLTLISAALLYLFKLFKKN